MNFPYSKKWIALTVAAMVMTSGSGLAMAATSAAPEKATTQQVNVKKEQEVGANDLTVEKAVELTLENNLDYKKAKINVDNAMIGANAAAFASVRIKEDMIENTGTASSKYVGTVKAEGQEKLGKLALKRSEGSFKLGAEKLYFDLLNAEDDLALKKQSLERSESQLKIANAAFGVGTRAKTDVLQAEAGVAQAKAAVAQAESAKDIARLELNKFMGMDLNKKWNLLTKQTNENVEVMDVEKAIAKALKEHVDILTAEQEITNTEKELEVIEKYSILSGFEGQMTKNRYETNKLALTQTQNQVKMDLMQSYYNLNSIKTALEALKKGTEAASENYRLTKLRFENGLATAIEVVGAEEELSKAENSYQKNLHQLNLAVMAYENAVLQSTKG
ncbi:TolC family protein [Brevibacillus laterosporus]|uniref:TolC family protein n=1 Tax=Brevibacillus laterosporus TaxID=1465 RepID=UPI00037BE9B7|nr:TolC family protein [Brevibacillus laterosporus]ATO49146.1 transporter [Brevibacillus laterosporus DSM 25]MBG9803607.1 transporter [Brevibacillus laterosporus]MED2003558.1 TolC family protein [Brevibacillus laterosporus]MED4763174.1 TolC family protein [Brevibacillus laterosporus]TPH19838.1 TolC family protein [Brevibacillus laterosporus]